MWGTLGAPGRDVWLCAFPVFLVGAPRACLFNRLPFWIGTKEVPPGATTLALGTPEGPMDADCQWGSAWLGRLGSGRSEPFSDRPEPPWGSLALPASSGACEVTGGPRVISQRGAGPAFPPGTDEQGRTESPGNLQGGLGQVAPGLAGLSP